MHMDFLYKKTNLTIPKIPLFRCDELKCRSQMTDLFTHKGWGQLCLLIYNISYIYFTFTSENFCHEYSEPIFFRSYANYNLYLCVLCPFCCPDAVIAASGVQNWLDLTIGCGSGTVVLMILCSDLERECKQLHSAI